MAGHTRGDWDFACDGYGKVQHSRKYDCVFASIRDEGGERLVTIAARIENPADARLIAAAPDLLAACEALHVRLFREQGGQENSPWAAPLAVLSKAIAKAKGAP